MPALRIAVDAAFEVTARGMRRWPDPHPDRQVADEEYSRLTDPAKWRIVGARVDAWATALGDLAIATVERDAAAEWAHRPGATISRTDVISPGAAGALTISVGRTVLGGVLIGVGAPADWLALVPDCGCDACDSGSAAELDVVDTWMTAVASGTLRRLRRGTSTVTIADGIRSGSGTSRVDIAHVLADPRGWDELAGTPWLDG